MKVLGAKLFQSVSKISGKKIRDLLTLAVRPGSLILLDCEGDAVSWRKQDMGTFLVNQPRSNHL